MSIVRGRVFALKPRGLGDVFDRQEDLFYLVARPVNRARIEQHYAPPIDGKKCSTSKASMVFRSEIMVSSEVRSCRVSAHHGPGEATLTPVILVRNSGPPAK